MMIRYYFLFLILFCTVFNLPVMGQTAREQVWVVLGEANEEWGIHIPNQDKRTSPSQGNIHDGRSKPIRIGGQSSRTVGDKNSTPNRMAFDKSSYAFYFQVDEDFLYNVNTEAYVTIVYYDSGIGLFQLQYDSADSTASADPWYGQSPQLQSYAGSIKAGGSVPLLNTGRWLDITFHLPDARFANRQWYDGDLRIVSNKPVFIHEVNISLKPPPNYKEGKEVIRERVQRYLTPIPRLHPGFDIIIPDGIAITDTISFDLSWIDVFTTLGVTLLETTISWANIEKKPGEMDFGFYDSLFSRCISSGMKWSLSIPWGTYWSTPEWFRNSGDADFIRCLEHKQDGGTQSPWNPQLYRQAERFMGVLGTRYGGRGLVRSVIIGPLGDMGCSGFVSNSTCAKKYQYHSHTGWWCGDSMAISDFQYFLRSRYQKIETLNKVWQSFFNSFGAIFPFLPEKAPSWRAMAEFEQWYNDSLNRWNMWWVQQARVNFPEAEIYLRCSGKGVPAEGGQWSTQLKSMAAQGGGCRFFSDVVDYNSLVVQGGLLTTAAKLFGARFGIEYQTPQPEPSALLPLIYAAAPLTVPSGQSLFMLPSALISQQSLPLIRSYFYLLGERGKAREPVVDTAVLYPWTWFTMMGAQGPQDNGPGRTFWTITRALRDLTNIDIIDNVLIGAGALQKYRFLIIPAGTIWEEQILQSLLNWVQRGGVLIAPNIGTLTTIEGDEKYFDILLNKRGMKSSTKQKDDPLTYFTKTIENGTIVLFSGTGVIAGSPGDSTIVNPDFLKIVDKVLYNTSQINKNYSNQTRFDGEVDGVYATRLRSEVVYLNDTDTAIEKTITIPNQPNPIIVKLPPHSIIEQKLE